MSSIFKLFAFCMLGVVITVAAPIGVFWAWHGELYPNYLLTPKYVEKRLFKGMSVADVEHALHLERGGPSLRLAANRNADYPFEYVVGRLGLSAFFVPKERIGLSFDQSHELDGAWCEIGQGDIYRGYALQLEQMTAADRELLDLCVDSTVPMSVVSTED